MICSKGSSDLPLFTGTGDRVSHFLPADRKHHISRFAASHHNAEVITGRGKVVEALVTERNNRAPDNVTDAEHFIHNDTIFLNGSHIFFPDEGLESQLVGAAVVLGVGGGGENGRDIVVVRGCFGRIRIRC